MTERQNEILKALIKEYIKTAEPISSEFLAKKYDFGLCPSAIRIEMQLLIKGGFLEQPHTSAGRIPTDRAYRFFVDTFVEPKEERSIEAELNEILNKQIDDQFKLAGNLAKFLAGASSGLAIIHFVNNDVSWKEGWDEIAREPEFLENNFAFNLLNFLDNFEEKIKNIESSGVNIYIGHEIPIPKADNLSLICSTCSISDKEKAFVSILGPKRMDYTKNINLIHSINKVLKDLL
ncbi:MAG: hypothetical protein WC470_02905 [Candidatus Paceibacterota bacterium]